MLLWSDGVTETDWYPSCLQISFKNTYQLTEVIHSEALTRTTAPVTLRYIDTDTHNTTETVVPTQHSSAGPRRGAAGADGACTGKGEATGPAPGVHPAGC